MIGCVDKRALETAGATTSDRALPRVSPAAKVGHLGWACRQADMRGRSFCNLNGQCPPSRVAEAIHILFVLFTQRDDDAFHDDGHTFRTNTRVKKVDQVQCFATDRNKCVQRKRFIRPAESKPHACICCQSRSSIRASFAKFPKLQPNNTHARTHVNTGGIESSRTKAKT